MLIQMSMHLLRVWAKLWQNKCEPRHQAAGSEGPFPFSLFCKQMLWRVWEEEEQPMQLKELCEILPEFSSKYKSELLRESFSYDSSACLLQKTQKMEASTK